MKHFALLGCALIFFFTSCSLDRYQKGEMIFLHLSQGDLPLLIHENRASKTAIIFLHGGPGDGSQFYAYAAGASFESLERHYTVIYWDQRSSGNAQGNETYLPSVSLMLEQYSKDLDDVITLVDSLYDFDSLFLMGHSWGGMLGNYYFTSDSTRQSRLSGWISIAGLHDTISNIANQKAIIQNYAASNSDDPYWIEAMVWLENNPNVTLTMNTLTQFFTYLAATAIDAPSTIFDIVDLDILIEMSLFSPFSVLQLYSNSSARPFTVIQSLYEIDFSDQMYQITIPALIIGGRYDINVPIQQAEEAYALLGTSPIDKRLVILENSDHGPMFCEPQVFADAIISFVEAYK